eukprot:g3758.t1
MPIEFVAEGARADDAPLPELGVDLDSLEQEIRRDDDDTLGARPWARQTAPLLRSLLGREDFLHWCRGQDSEQGAGPDSTVTKLRALASRLETYEVSVVKGCWGVCALLDDLALLMTALASATERFSHLDGLLSMGLQLSYTMVPDEDLARNDPIALGLVAHLHPFSRVVRAADGLARSIARAPSAPAALPARARRGGAAGTAKRRKIVEPPTFSVAGSREQLGAFAETIEMFLTTKSLAALKARIKEFRDLLEWEPRVEVSEELRKLLKRSSGLYANLYVASACLQTAGAVCAMASAPFVTQNRALTAALVPAMQLQNQLIDAGANMVLRQRWLWILYQIARLWAEAGDYAPEQLVGLYRTSLPACSVFLCPVTKASKTKDREAFLLQRDDETARKRLAVFPVLSGIGLADRHVRCYRSAASCLSVSADSSAHSYYFSGRLKLLRNQKTGRLFMPVIGSAAALYFDGAEPLLRRLTLVRLASDALFGSDALWTMSKLTCLEAQASERLQELPASIARADQAGRPDFFEAAERLCVLPPSSINGVCFCREYTRALRFRLDGRSVLLKDALPLHRTASVTPSGTDVSVRECDRGGSCLKKLTSVTSKSKCTENILIDASNSQQITKFLKLTPRMREWITECLQGGVEMSTIKEALVSDHHELFRVREHIHCRAFFPSADMFRDFVRIETSLLQLDKDDFTAASKFLTQTVNSHHIRKAECSCAKTDDNRQKLTCTNAKRKLQVYVDGCVARKVPSSEYEQT